MARKDSTKPDLNEIVPQKPLPMERQILHDLFHETKNPLQIIYSASRLLESSQPAKKRTELCGAIRENADKINMILNLFADVVLEVPDPRTAIKNDLDSRLPRKL